MKILDFLDEKAISIDLQSSDKESVIKELVNVLAKAGKVSNEKDMVKILLERESLGSTGIGQSIAIPHGKSSKTKEMVGVLGLSKKHL